MPQTINGTGTWYHGKRNKFTVTDQCEQCGNLAKLTSYDTTKYFQLLYIPLIPLSKLRVLNECGVCQMHAIVKLKDWEANKADAIATATETLREEPQAAESQILAKCGVEEEAVQLAGRDQRRTPAGEALAVERVCCEAAGIGRVVHQREQRRRDDLTDPVGERGAPLGHA